jgi:hypothetical protein
MSPARLFHFRAAAIQAPAEQTCLLPNGHRSSFAELVQPTANDGNGHIQPIGNIHRAPWLGEGFQDAFAHEPAPLPPHHELKALPLVASDNTGQPQPLQDSLGSVPRLAEMLHEVRRSTQRGKRPMDLCRQSQGRGPRCPTSPATCCRRGRNASSSPASAIPCDAWRPYPTRSTSPISRIAARCPVIFDRHTRLAQ